MDRDRNLLFGVFAVQLNKVSATQLVDAAAMWASDRSRTLPERLVEIDAISAKDCAFIERIVDEAIHEHGGDATTALMAFGGKEQVDFSFRCSIVCEGDDGMHTQTPSKSSSAVRLDNTHQMGVPETPGRYTRLGEHGRGGMARVFLVHDQFVGRDIALKDLLPQYYFSGKKDTPGQHAMGMMSRFLQEARITGQLEHPSIVPVYELGRHRDGSLYYTMKFVRGRTLSKAIEEATGLRGRLALLPHFTDLCNAVAYAHSRKILHRDLKPSNIMVGEFGETVVLDWGLAKMQGQPDSHSDGMSETLRAMNIGDSACQNQTTYGHAIGTPAYMPPEQARGQLDLIDERSDVYALGAVLYEMLTGTLPFQGESTRDVLRKVLEESPPTIENIAKGVPPELAAICRRAMEKDPQHRYASAKDLAQEIERFQTGALVEAYSYKPYEHLRRFVKHNKAMLATACAAAVLLFFLSGLYVVNLHVAYQRAESAQQREAEQRRAAEKAEQQARQVSEFQSRMLQDIDIELMGIRLREDLLEQAHAAMQRSHYDEVETDARLVQLEDLLAGISFTTTAYSILDRNVLAQAHVAIDRDYRELPLVQAALLEAVASSYLALRSYDKAQSPQDKALDIRRRILGDEHPDTLSSISAMGELLSSQSRYEEAELYLLEALDGRRRILGDEHTDTHSSISAMGEFLRRQDRYEEAEPYLLEALDGWRRILGDEHPDTLSSISAMGELLSSQSRYEEAELYLLEALDGRRRILGDEHPVTLNSLSNMVLLRGRQGKYEEAEQYFAEVLDGRRRFHGNVLLQDALNSLSAMGELLSSQGRYEEAEQYFAEVLDFWRCMLGDEHPLTLISLSNMGVLRGRQGKFDEAEMLLLDTFTALESQLEPSNLPLTNLASSLADFYSAWHEAAPNAGHESTAARWRARAEVIETSGCSQSKEHVVVSDEDSGELIRQEPIETKIIMLPGDVPLEMVWIPPGSFMMGRYPGEQNSDITEDPQHEVTIANGFWMGKYSITQAQWQAVMGNNQSSFKGDNRPVEWVSWDDIRETDGFLDKINALSPEYNFRLPSEAEWEYAYRAGTTTRFYWGDDPEYTEIDDYAWYWDNSGSETHDVGQKLPNAWGLYDMAGNVREWIEDDWIEYDWVEDDWVEDDWIEAGWHDYYEGAPSDGSAWVDSPRGSRRLLRGGSRGDSPLGCRAARRRSDSPDRRSSLNGFRVVFALD